jgi:hypothetical protein
MPESRVSASSSARSEPSPAIATSSTTTRLCGARVADPRRLDSTSSHTARDHRIANLPLSHQSDVSVSPAAELHVLLPAKLPPPTCTPLRPGLRAKGCLSASELPYDLCFTTWPPGIGHATCPRRLLIALQRMHLAPRPRPRPLHARCPTSCALPPPLPEPTSVR